LLHVVEWPVRQSVAVPLILWASSAIAAGSPAELFSVSHLVGSKVLAPAVGAAAAHPIRLEDLLLAPEVAVPAPVHATLAPGTRVYEDLWDRIRDGFAISALNSPLVERWQSWYLGRPRILKGILDRSRRHLSYVAEEVAKRGLPMELALLPMIESGYDPRALSPADAYGLWQFIPATAREYNLPLGPNSDARADVAASTEAALDYLESLYRLFHDWQLALAAYNWGEKALARAIERNVAKGLPTDYGALSLPEETRNYLPKLQALKNLIASPDAFHFEIEPITSLVSYP